MRTYLEPTAPTAPTAIVVDDPKVAMDLAIAVCDSPRMSNLAHGLWGYLGTRPDGTQITIQSLGIGGPSAAAVMSDLADLGVSRAIRIGSCIAIGPGSRPGSRVLATRFLPCDGAGSALSGGQDLKPDRDLTDALAAAITPASRGPVRSTDIVGRGVIAEDGAVGLDLSSAAFAGASARAGMAFAAALVVARVAQGESLVGEALERALIALGSQAVSALGAVPQPSGP